MIDDSKRVDNLKDSENRLKTLLLTLNESDLLNTGGIKNLFSRFPFIRDSGIETLIVHVDILPAKSRTEKDSLVHFLGKSIRSAFQAHGDSGMNCCVFGEAEDGMNCGVFGEAEDGMNFVSFGKVEGDIDFKPLPAGSFSIIFSLGSGGRDELKNILSAFIEDCRAGKTQPADMTPDYISSHLALPFAPDLIVSSSKNELADFMIWQTVYSEYYFMDKEILRWTDSDFKKAFNSFHNRERRYGV